MDDGSAAKGNSTRIHLLVIVLLALAVRLTWALQDRVVWGDEPFYLWLGKNWLTGQGYSFTGYPDVHHTPLYPFLTGILYLLIGDLDWASRIWYVIMGTGLVVPVYWIGRRMYGHRAGIVAGFLVAIYPALTAAILRWGTMTEPPYYLFVYAGLYAALLALDEDRPLTWGLAGLALGLAYLTRPEAIGYFLLFGGYLATIRLLQRRLFLRRTLVRLAGYLLGFALCFLPYLVYVRNETGAWMVSEKTGVTFLTGIPLAYGDVAGFDKATWGLDRTGEEVLFFSQQSYTMSMTGWIRANPREFARLIYQNSQRFVNLLFSRSMFPIYFVPLLILAWFQSAWPRRRTEREGLLAISVGPAVAFVLFVVVERYIAAILPLLLIWTGYGLELLGRWFVGTADNLIGAPLAEHSGKWRRALWALPVALVLLYSAAIAPGVWARTSAGSYRAAHKTAGLWLREVASPDTVVMARYPAIAFHAGTRWVATPNAGYEQVLRYARKKGVAYWAIDERETHKLRPQFAPLIEGPPPPEMELVWRYNEGGEALVIYRLRAQLARQISPTMQDGAHG